MIECAVTGTPYGVRHKMAFVSTLCCLCNAGQYLLPPFLLYCPESTHHPLTHYAFYCILIYILNVCLEEVNKRMWKQVDPQAGPRQSGSSPPISWPYPPLFFPPLISGSTLFLWFPQWELFHEHSLERIRYHGDHPESTNNWLHLRFLYKLAIFWQMGSEIYLSVAAPNNFVSNFPCLWSLPPMNLEWSASFFIFFSCPPCKWTSLPTNICLLLLCYKLHVGKNFYLYSLLLNSQSLAIVEN